MKQQTQYTTLINFLMVLCSFGITAKETDGDTQFFKSSNSLDDPYQGDLVIKKLCLLITNNNDV